MERLRHDRADHRPPLLWWRGWLPAAAGSQRYAVQAFNTLERVALDWVAQLCGIPAAHQGVFSSGGSTANLVALGAARQWAFERRGLDVSQDGLPSGAQARVYASEQAHHTIQRATAWFHVGGAYGLIAAASPALRPAFAAVADADSVIVDPHKWLATGAGCAATYVRDAGLLLRAFAQGAAAYLEGSFSSGEDDAVVQFDSIGVPYMDMGVELSAPSRGDELTGTQSGMPSPSRYSPDARA